MLTIVIIRIYESDEDEGKIENYILRYKAKEDIILKASGHFEDTLYVYFTRLPVNGHSIIKNIKDYTNRIINIEDIESLKISIKESKAKIPDMFDFHFNENHHEKVKNLPVPNLPETIIISLEEI